MSTAAERAREKAERLAAKQKASTTDDAPALPAGTDLPAAADTKPVRVTVDMAPPLFAAFEEWAGKAQRQHRLGRSAKADVLRILTRRLMADTDLQDEILQALIAERRK